MPALELADGTIIAQSNSILKYVADVYNLRPADPLVNAKADAFGRYTMTDVFPKLGPKTFSKAETRDKDLQEAINAHIPGWFDKLAAKLPADKKFLCGDTITIYDF